MTRPPASLQKIARWTIVTACLLGASALMSGELPVLNWTERSDWINIKTDVSPAAVGDGVADDTAAIQAALNTNGTGRTIYFPPGTYRITNTLVMTRGNPGFAMTLIGHGRSSRLEWHGSAGRNLIHIDGNPYARYEGLTLDGRNLASRGFAFTNAINRFETSVKLKNMAFRNFREYGVQAVKETGPVALAETSYENCIFENCGRGIGLMNFNDYDHTVAGCDFINCSTGLYASSGNFYVRDCFFTNSTTCDIYVRPEHNCTVRRCKSVGSRQFINSSSSVCPLTVMDCYVDKWTLTTAGGAITHPSTPPLILSHCRFVRPPATAVAPVSCSTAFVCTNMAPSNSAVVSATTIHTITPGTNGPRVGGPGGAIVTTFVNTNVQVPSFVFDAKIDFGAVGDGSANDTTAAQNTINAARAAGNGALAYFPIGTYRVTNTLDVSGSNYVIGGCGYFSRIRWDGPTNGTTILVRNPDRIRLEHMMIGHHDLLATYPNLMCSNDVEIVCTTTTPCRVTIDGLELFGKYQSKPWRQGLLLNTLGTNCTVILNAICGNLRFRDSGDAIIIGNVTYEGAITINDTASSRKGFLGIQTRLSTFNDYPVNIHDNNSIVFSDYYMEQGNGGFLLTGSSTNPPGRIVLQQPKIGFATNWLQPLIVATNYSGDVIFGGCQFYADSRTNNVNHTGTNAFRVHFFGNLFYNSRLQFNSPSGTLCALGNKSASISGTGVAPSDANTNLTRSAASLALDDLQRLGILDIELNYPHVPLPERPYVTVTSGSHGTVTPQGQVTIPWGGSTSFVTRADTYFRIGSVATNGVTVPAASNSLSHTSIWSNVWYSGTLAADFTANVTSNTGTPEWWLAMFGWTNNFTAAATNDTDNDGFPAWEEYLADTVPTNPASLLRITGIGFSNNAVNLSWQGGTGVYQFIERRSDLVSTTETWRTVFTNTPPTASVFGQFDDNSTPQTPSHYRIRAQR